MKLTPADNRQLFLFTSLPDTKLGTRTKTLDVFDEQQQRSMTLSLFTEDRPVPADGVDTIQVKRAGHSPHPSSVGASGRCPCPGCVSGVLPDGNAEASASSPCSWFDSESCVGETCGDTNTGCVPAYDRWPLPGDAALHRAGGRPRAIASPAASAAGCRSSCHRAPTQNVV